MEYEESNVVWEGIRLKEDYDVRVIEMWKMEGKNVLSFGEVERDEVLRCLGLKVFLWKCYRGVLRGREV